MNRKSLFRLFTCFLAVMLFLPMLASPAYAATPGQGGSGSVTVDGYTLGYSWTSAAIKNTSGTGHSDKNWDAAVEASGGTITLKAKNSTKYKWIVITYDAQDVRTFCKLVNNTEQTLLVTYSVASNVTVPSGAAASGTIELAPGDTYPASGDGFYVTKDVGASETNATYESGAITISKIEKGADPKLSFYSSNYGSVSYAGGDISGTVAKNGEAATDLQFAAGSTVKLTAAVDNSYSSSYSFYGWMADGALLSTANPYDYTAAKNISIYPVFLPKDTVTAGGNFTVNGTKYMFWHQAVNAAASSGKTIILAANYTLPSTLEENGLNSIVDATQYSSSLSFSGSNFTYTVPSGIKLLVPYSNSDSGDFGAEPSDFKTQQNAYDLCKEGGIAKRNTVHYTLTVPAGNKIDCYGQINVNGQRQSDGQPYIGVALGAHGRIHLAGSASESQLIIRNNAKLYCYGFIIGTGTVEIMNGGTLHEFMQICDWMGGSNAQAWAGREGTSHMFPMSNFYIQNIESRLKINYGANCYIEMVLTASGLSLTTNTAYISASSGIFQMGTNGCIVREYNVAEDRMTYRFYGDCSIGSIQIKKFSIDLNSAEYILPVNGHMTLVVEDDATLTADKKFAVLPGAELIVKEKGTVNLSGELYILDYQDWTQSYYFNRVYDSGVDGTFANKTQNHAPLPYVATLNSISPTASQLLTMIYGTNKTEGYYMDAPRYTTSGKVTVNGTVNVSGMVCTSNKNSSADKVIDGTGVINYTGTPGTGALNSGYAGTVSNIKTTYGLANIAGEGLLQPIDSAGTYYGFYDDADGNGTEEYWWSTNERTFIVHLMLDGSTEVETRCIPMYDGFDVTAYYTDAACTTKATSDFAGTDLYAIAEAKIVRSDETLYALTLQSAVQNATRSGDQVYLLRDAAVDKAIKIEASQNIGIYLNGHTITYTTTVFDNYGVLNLDFQGGSMENGTIVPYSAVVANQKGGTLDMTLNGGTLLWSTSTAPSKGTFGLVYNYSGGTANIDLSGGTMNLEYKYSKTNDYQYRFFTIYNCGTMDLKDSVGTGLLTSSFRGNSTFATGGTTRGWAILPAPLCNYNGSLTAQNLHITDTSASGGNAGCIINYHGTITELHNVTMKSNYHYGIVNTGGTINSVVGCQIEARSYGIYNGSTYKCPDDAKANDFAITKQGNIKEITDTKVTVTETSAILNRAQIGTIGGSSGLQAKTATIHVDDIMCGSGSKMITTTTDSAGNTVKTYNWTQIPAVGKITDSVTITATSDNAITNEGTITEISGNVSINANAASSSSQYAVCILNGGYIDAIKESVSINSSGHNAVYLSGQRVSTETTDVNGTKTTSYDRTSGIGSISGAVITAKYNTINNAGNIEKIEDGTVVLATVDSADYYALKNTGSIELISGGNYYHPKGASNIVNNSGTLNYPDGKGISEDTQAVTVNDKPYDCHYITDIHTHDYSGKPAFDWKENGEGGYTVTATLTCGADGCPDEPITGDATVTSEVTKNATCTELGKELFMAKVKLNEQEYESTKEVDIPALGHTYDGWINTDPENHWQECSVCKLKSGEAAHSDSGDEDTNCDTCGRELHTHVYSNCGDVVTHGNCQTETIYQAKCSCGEISGIITGEKDTSKHTGELIWTQTAEKHTQSYSCCNAVTVAEENHEWSNGNCSECAYVCEHKDDDLDHICDYGCGVYQGVHADAADDGDHVCDYGCKEVLEDCSDVTTDGDHACDICGKQDVTQHSYTSKVTDPTCVDKGYTTYTCNCGDTYTADEVEANGHKYTESVTKAPSCTEPGEKTFTCSACGDSYTEEIEKTGHTEGTVVVENEKAATCKAAGSYDNVIYCTVCKAELSRETIVVEKLAHTAGSAVEENRKESTCTVAGSYDSVVKCSVCGEEMSRNTVALNLAAHTEGTVVVENEKTATCTAEGSYDNVVYCTVCNAELSRQTVTTDEMGHTEVVDAAKTPTCTETGLTEGKHCSVCGEVLVKQETVDALGHDYESVVTAPTFDAQGYTTHTCSKCGDSYVDNYLAALIAVAQVGEQKYESLTEAVAEAAEGATVTLLTDATGAGMMINKNITIDFGGHTYTLNKTVGSAGTETLGFQILKDNNVTLKNGTLTSTAVTSGKEVKVLIQNYANLTLTDMDLEGTNENILYGLSSNSGKITLNGDTDITVHEKAVAFDVYDYSAAGYAVPSMKVNTTGKINGKIEVSETASLAISGGTFTTKIEEKWCAEGFIPTANTDGTYGVKVGAYVAETDGKKYETLAEAVAAAENGSTVNLLTDASGAGVVVNKDITIDFDGHTYTLNRAVGSAGTETLGFQILKENNVTLKNGILTSTNAVSGKEVKVLIQNYSDLTLTDMDLIGTNTNIQYALSNNSGNIVLNGNTDITVHENAVAFDVYDYSVAGYAVPSMKVNTTGKITGNIEVSETATLAISGGTFTTKIEEKWCAEGFIPTVNTDGTYGVKAGVYVAQNGETKYETLADAIAAEGEKVIVLQDITIHGPIPATDKIIDFNGHTISGTLLGTLKLNNGTLITAEGKKMAGPDADYYQTTDAMFTMDAALNINVLSGTMTLVPDEWWTLPGQKLEISEGASFVIPAGKTLQVRSEVIVNGEVTIDGTVNLHDANATVTTAIENLNIITTAGDKVWYTEGKYVVHTHTPGAEVTCTEDQICTVCGDVLKEATGHTLTQIEAKAPTCTEIGWEASEKCSVCDYTTYQEIAAKGHSYESEVTAPTCTAEGYTTYTCSVCNDSYVADKVNALGHTDAEAVKENEKAPTCTDDGSYESVVYCSVCDAELSRNTVTVSASGHTAGEAVTENEKAATCTADGSYDTVVYCTVCDAELSRVTTTVGQLGHSYDDGVETKAPTCTEEGVKTFTCGTCGDTYTEAIKAAGHKESSSVTAPTCTEKGYTTVTCSVCGNSYTTSEVPAKGHAWVEADCDTPKTCTVCGETEGEPTGEHTYKNGVCTDCGAQAPVTEINVNVEIVGAANKAQVTAPENGWQVGTNTFYVTNDLACVVVVSYNNGETYECLPATADGARYKFTADNVTEDTLIKVALKGDATEDGKVNNMDVTRMKQLANGVGKAATALQQKSCDLVGNNDGIKNNDVTRIKQLANGVGAVMSW